MEEHTHHIPTPLNATNGIEMWQALKRNPATKVYPCQLYNYNNPSYTSPIEGNQQVVYPENRSQNYKLSLSRDSLQSPVVEGALAIRRIFSLVDMITKPKFLNCPNIFKIGLFR